MGKFKQKRFNKGNSGENFKVSPNAKPSFKFNQKNRGEKAKEISNGRKFHQNTDANITGIIKKPSNPHHKKLKKVHFVKSDEMTSSNEPETSSANNQPLFKKNIQDGKFEKKSNGMKRKFNNEESSSFKPKKPKFFDKGASFISKFKKAKSSEGDDTSKNNKQKLVEMKRKDRKKVRQQSENKSYDLGMKTKHIWEQLRRKNCTQEEKTKLLNELCNIVKGRVSKLIFAHDTVRVIECLVSLGTSEQLDQIFEELKDSIVLLAKSKYAKFFLLKIIRHGKPAQRQHVIQSFCGKTVRLCTHKEASSVIEFAYNEYANAHQRALLEREFFGPVFMAYNEAELVNLSQFFEKYPEHKVSVLNHTKQVITKMIEKGLHKHTVVHHILKEFITCCDPTSRSEIIEVLREIVVEILHTKDGSRVGMHCVWHGTAKDRKVIIKSLKQHIVKIAKEQHGQLVLLAVFDVVDDTKHVTKVILGEIFKNFLEIASDSHGKRVILYILHHRDPKFFHPDVNAILSQGDHNEISKKDPGVRRKELLEAASLPLIKLVEENCQKLIITTTTCLVALSIIQNATGDISNVMRAIAKLLTEPYTPPKGENFHMTENFGAHLVFKKLVYSDKDRIQENKPIFSKMLIEEVPEGVFKSWIECNRGAFMLIYLLETGIEEVVQRIKAEMKGQFKTLNSKEHKGAELLLQKLKSS